MHVGPSERLGERQMRIYPEYKHAALASECRNTLARAACWYDHLPIALRRRRYTMLSATLRISPKHTVHRRPRRVVFRGGEGTRSFLHSNRDVQASEHTSTKRKRVGRWRRPRESRQTPTVWTCRDSCHSCHSCPPDSLACASCLYF